MANLTKWAKTPLSKKQIGMSLLWLLVAAGLMRACGSGAASAASGKPTAQADMEARLSKFKSDWRDADSDENKLVRNNVEGAFNAWREDVKAHPIKAQAWQCDISKIDGQSSLDCNEAGVVYHITLATPNPKLLSSAKSGDTIRFDGVIARETSWSESGGIREPEMEVNDAVVTKE